MEENGTEEVAETAECPNCGRQFVGDYCPDCGEEVGLPVTAWNVIGGFFRELGDLERGFWPTLLALTLRPGHVLREYLRGARSQFIHPGRYLLATGLVGYGLSRAANRLNLPFSGADGPEGFRFREPELTKAGGAGDTLQLTMAVDVGQNTDIIVLLTAVLAGTYVWRLFQSEIESQGEAVALTLYAGGHVWLIGSICGALFQAMAFLSGIGDSLSEDTAAVLAVPFGALLVLGYFGISFGTCFSGWQDGLKGAVAYIWSFFEVMGGLVAAGAAYTGYRLWTSPAQYLPEPVEVSRVSEAFPGIFAVIAVSVLPAFIHLTIEAYYRWT